MKKPPKLKKRIYISHIIATIFCVSLFGYHLIFNFIPFMIDIIKIVKMK